MSTTAPASESLTRSARIRTAVEGVSVLQLLVLIGTTLLVLLGALLGGRAYVAAADSGGLVSQPAVTTATGNAAEGRETTRPTTSDRVSRSAPHRADSGSSQR